METPDPSVGVDLLRLALQCRDIDKNLSSKTGLSVDEMHCLCLIHTEKPPCVKILSEMMDINATRTSKILWSLERKGYVVRTMDTADRRKELITLTVEGQGAAERILSLYDEMKERLLEHCPTEFTQHFPWLKRAGQ
jgi:DNA-binding MarR family transcriptional regulator